MRPKVMMTMPRTMQEILEHAEELAKVFEDAEPAPAGQNADALAQLRAVVLHRAEVESAVAKAVGDAREAGHSWSSIGAMLGTSGEAARQRYAKLIPTSTD